MSARFQQKCGTRCRSDGLGSCDPPHPELPTHVESKKVSVHRRHWPHSPYRQCAQQNLLNHPSSTSNCNWLKSSESNPDIENNVRIDTRVSWRLRMSSSPKKHTTFFIPYLEKEVLEIPKMHHWSWASLTTYVPRISQRFEDFVVWYIELIPTCLFDGQLVLQVGTSG